MLVTMVILAVAMAATAYADMGPTPSVNITFTGIEGETYYATLLSDKSSNGPSSAWDGTSEYKGSDYDIWKKFVEYEDSDGFYFLQEWWDCSETNGFSWSYRAPDTYKILVYFPESDSFCVTSIYDGYAFHSYYTVDLSQHEAGVISVKSEFNLGMELLGFAFRVALTVLVELIIALAFRYRGKKQIRFIICANIATQLALNIMLNVTNYKHSVWLIVMALYIVMELAVLVIEAVLYAVYLDRLADKPRKPVKAVIYALIANVCSFAAGVVLAHLSFGYF